MSFLFVCLSGTSALGHIDVNVCRKLDEQRRINCVFENTAVTHECVSFRVINFGVSNRPLSDPIFTENRSE
jgi:hypothetical protein